MVKKNKNGVSFLKYIIQVSYICCRAGSTYASEQEREERTSVELNKQVMQRQKLQKHKASQRNLVKITERVPVQQHNKLKDPSPSRAA